MGTLMSLWWSLLTTSWYTPRIQRSMLNNLRLIFERLRKHQLFAKASKCTLHVNEVEFLGQWIMLEGAAPIAKKLHAVRDWEPPNSVKDVRSFLGFANYYRRFVPGYAGIASPLTLLTKKNIEWHWGPVQRNSTHFQS